MDADRQDHMNRVGVDGVLAAPAWMDRIPAVICEALSDVGRDIPCGVRGGNRSCTAAQLAPLEAWLAGALPEGDRIVFFPEGVARNGSLQTRAVRNLSTGVIFGGSKGDKEGVSSISVGARPTGKRRQGGDRWPKGRSFVAE